MQAVLLWMMGLAIALCAIVLSAGARMPLVHMAMTGTISLIIALQAIQEHRRLTARGETETAIAASTARHMGFVWVWGALGLMVTYLFILDWREWWPFFLGLAVAAGLCLGYAILLEKEIETGRHDAGLLSFGRGMTIAQLVGMVITVVGLLVDGKMTRYLNPRHLDWAANNIFFFGAIAIAAISAHALLATKRKAA